MQTSNQLDLKIRKNQSREKLMIPYITTSGVINYYVIGSGNDFPDDFKDWYKPEQYFG